MKTKNNINLIKENMKFIINNNQFRLIILLLICFNLYGTAYLAINLSYFDGLINILTNGYYVITLMALILLNTINTFDRFEKNQFFIIRFQDRKTYLKQLIINVVISNSILFILNLIIILIGLNMFASGGFVIKTILDYIILNVIYVIFYIIRFLLIILIISIINVCLLKIINNKTVVGLNVVIWLSILFVPYSPMKVISSIQNMFLIIPDYMRLHYYSDFSLEVLCSTIYILSLLGLTSILFIITKNKMKNIGV